MSRSSSRRPKSAAASAQGCKAISDLLDDDPALLRRISIARPARTGRRQDADFVFEAAPEKLPLKQQIFAELEMPGVEPTPSSPAIHSAIPSTEIGRHLKHRERVVGTHFWNPPHLVPLVEVIQNEKTSGRGRAKNDRTAARRRQVRCMSAAIFPASSATGCSTR